MDAYPVLTTQETQYKERMHELYSMELGNKLTPKESQEINDLRQHEAQQSAKSDADREAWFKKHIPQYASLTTDERKQLINTLICEMSEAVSRRADELGFSIGHTRICGSADGSNVLGRVIHQGLNDEADLDFYADSAWDEHWCGL
jgi:hypothetical protein